MLSDRVRNLVFALSLVAGQLLLIAATLLWPGDGTIGASAGVLTTWAMTCWVGGMVAMAFRLKEAAPVASIFAAAIGVVGAVGGSNFGAEAVVVSANAPSEHASALAYGLAFLGPGLGFPLALLLFGLMSFRSPRTPGWFGVLLILSGLLFPLRFAHAVPRGLVADGCLLLPVIWLAWSFARAETTRDPYDSSDRAVG